MTWIKICGITNLEDALVAVDAGADAVGFVFYEKSSRNMIPEKVRDIVDHLPEKIEKVGVFVSSSAEDLLRIIRTAGLTAMQHQFTFASVGSPESQAAIDRELFPARFQTFVCFPASFFLTSKKSIDSAAESFSRFRRQGPGQPASPDGIFETVFLDSGTNGQPGGTGEPFDWSKAMPIAKGMRDGGLKLVVAGGLRPENVRDAMEILHPWGVDVSSGVEAKPGKKDPQKVRAFVKAVREADRGNSRN
jgi:phosphoribosylanthranilate isomerase